MDTPGLTPTDEEKALVGVLRHAYYAPFALQSNYARLNAFAVAVAASMGLITTRVHPRSRTYGFLWRPTVEGLKFMEKHYV